MKDEEVIGLCNWIDEYSWCKNNETGLWNNRVNSGGESGITVEDMINSYLDC